MNHSANGFAASPDRLTKLRQALLALALLVAYSIVAIPAASAVSGELLDDDDEDWADGSYGTAMYKVAKAIDADDYWEAGYDGSGVDIAIIDSGVLPVPGLNGADKVINGPDLSFESQADNLIHLDTYGHGTHLAGIIAGHEASHGDDDDDDDDDEWDDDDWEDGEAGFRGIAPGARIVSLKVADSNGAVDVTQMIAAIDWVVQHRNDNGLNIRVLNLAYGTDGVQPHEVDPLHFAVERAWDAGIVVVVSVGNDGNAAPLRNPASDPFVIAVGATDPKGSSRVYRHEVAEFSNCGTAERHVDLVAPGKSIVSLRANGSKADKDHPQAQVGYDQFKGSGSSQAAAVVSGAAALIIDQRPGITPDQVKALLMDNARQVSGSALCQGAGTVDLSKVKYAGTPGASVAEQGHAQSSGMGSIDAARGNDIVLDEGVAIDGEVDIFGNEFSAFEWVQAVLSGASWSAGEWNGASWSGASWSGASWSGASWSGASWSGASWSGASWSGASWSSKIWSGASWSGASWSGASWSGASWSGGSWSGHVWNGLSWQ